MVMIPFSILKNYAITDNMLTFKGIISNYYHKHILWNSTTPNTNHSSGISTSSHLHGTPSTVSNVHHLLQKITRRHGDGI